MVRIGSLIRQPWKVEQGNLQSDDLFTKHADRFEAGRQEYPPDRVRFTGKCENQARSDEDYIEVKRSSPIATRRDGSDLSNRMQKAALTDRLFHASSSVPAKFSKKRITLRC